MKISAVVLTKNEEKNIGPCLESLAFCDEILVVDSDSLDKTREIASRMGAKVYQRQLSGDFSTLRNFGQSKARNDWVFFVDADERVNDSLREEIIEQISTSGSLYDGFYLKRADFMWRKELLHGETRNLKLLRLAKKEKGEWIGKVHEVWKVKGNIGELKNRLLHYPHPAFTEFLEEIQVYTDLRASELYEKRVKTNWFEIVVYPAGKFFLNYIFKLGFLDGMPGLIFAIVMSLHSFLVRAKLWLLWNNNK